MYPSHFSVFLLALVSSWLLGIWYLVPLVSSHDDPVTRKPLFGNFRCNRYFVRKTSFITCDIENICLATNGQFVLFHPSERLWGSQKDFLKVLNSEVWTYAQGRVETLRGNFQVRVIDADLVLEHVKQYSQNITNTSSQQISETQWLGASSISGWSNTAPQKIREIFTHYKKTSQPFTHDGVTITPIELDSNFTYFTTPTYALKRYAAGKFDRFLVDNLLMVVSLMMSYHPVSNSQEFESLLNHTILYLDDVFDKVTPNNEVATHFSDPSIADDHSLKMASLISKRPPLQLCETKLNHFSIEKLPCRNVGAKSSTVSNHHSKNQGSEKPLVLQSCFSHLLVGLTAPFHKNLYRRESVASTLRQLAYSNLNIRPLPHEENDTHRMIEYLDFKMVRVAIHKPSSHSHGPFIANAEEIAKTLKERFTSHNIQNDILLQQLIHLRSSILVEFFEFPKSFSHEHVNYFSTVDVFITDSGSAAYYSMFMRADTSMIVAPECTSVFNDTAAVNHSSRCESSVAFQTLKALPAVQVIDYLELDAKNVKCQRRDASAKARSICDPILDAQIMAESVVQLLKKRYLKILN
ncbi:hypothetical protein C9374_014258 [Naegleria lovaniensis]|uniref:Uncharacterized protein n=1 Tax=Naegleria lovaniensis TaxID=51637 RepID=A0AA88KBB0_NAELO|nr:uncharacterized protein C9374_014258 [Naegleria lovaniensis]KAG2370764.1 hypothetical protein C9374_014258 [Naegleria lovaniensis]